MEPPGVLATARKRISLLAALTLHGVSFFKIDCRCKGFKENNTLKNNVFKKANQVENFMGLRGNVKVVKN